MKCMKCASTLVRSTTTDVTELGSCLIIVRNVPCYKCPECDEVIYTGDVMRRLEQIVEQAKSAMSEISVIDFGTHAA